MPASRTACGTRRTGRLLGSTFVPTAAAQDRSWKAVRVRLEVHEATPADREVLERLIGFYFYDFSEFDGRDVQADGSYHYQWLDAYQTDADRRAYLFRVDGQFAGFALVRLIDPIEIAEFFVLRKYRRGGTGTAAARQVIARHPGRWLISQIPNNKPATSFWRRAIPVPFTQHELANGHVEQRFTVTR